MYTYIEAPQLGVLLELPEARAVTPHLSGHETGRRKQITRKAEGKLTES